MLAHYAATALRSIRATPFTSAVNVVTLAVGLVCFVTAYAAGVFWSSAEQQFRNVDDIHVLTISIKNRDNGLGLRNGTTAPDVAAEALKSDFPAITKIARAVMIDRKTMVANGANALRLFGVAVDPEFLEIFNLPFVAGDARSALTSPRSAVLTRECRHETVRLSRSDRQNDRDRQQGRHDGDGRDRRDSGTVAVRPLGQRAAAVRSARVARRVRRGSHESVRTSRGCADAAGGGLVHARLVYLFVSPRGGRAVGGFARSPAGRLRSASRPRGDVAQSGDDLRARARGQGARRYGRLLRDGALVRGRAASARRPRARRRMRELRESRDRARVTARSRDRRAQGARRVAGRRSRCRAFSRRRS